MTSGDLSTMPSTPIGHIMRAIRDGVDAARREPVLELLSLRMRADHAEEREVAASKDAFREHEIDAYGCASSR